MLTVQENVVNPDLSLQEDSQEGRSPTLVHLVQAIVADQGFLSRLSWAIMAC